uniref:Membrane bound FAD containing D-sorbitol dehydrogenase n=1 Tax=Candidatus Kentrum sp. UNK TaxID=2126344 RepID=A0A451B5V1_9GAMM|nr:MAG: Membrane bound FAD containing D-sorbitol dehydrogenase [Candidatus Kentron sp. UNK]VFK73659.1 MAG: Membrane bound FAD containing D-sorbitol dehydrogenase [Candidatus Kentron sp. UNK]
MKIVLDEITPSNKKFIDRRSFLAALSGTGVFLCFPRMARAGAAIGGIGNAADGNSLDVFLALSRHLTGFSDLDREMGQRYLVDLEQTYSKEAVGAMLRAFQFISDTQPSSLDASIRREIIDRPPVDEIARATMRIWYTGALNAPNVEQAAKAHAYTQGLLWAAIGVAPVGVPDKPTWGEPLREMTP